jgi:hypothetical protein
VPILKYLVAANSASPVRKSSLVVAPLVASLNLLTTSCGPLLAINADPGVGVPKTAIVKSIRCELMTFIVTNRYRESAFLDLYQKNFRQMDFRTAFANYAYIDVDDNQYAAIDANLKTLDMASLTVGLDWKTNVNKAGESHDKHLGPGISASKTYIADTLYAVPQDSRLGPKTPPDSFEPSSSKRVHQPQKFYQDADSSDVDYYCYKNERGMPAPHADLRTFEALSDHQYPQFENFDRIYVASDNFVPLARWLQIQGTEMAQATLSIDKNMENILPGQLSYSFALDVKPSIDLKYTLVATVISPAVPELMASREDTDTFTIYLNTKSAKFASGGKSGGTTIYTPDTSTEAWGPVHQVKVEQKLPPPGAAPGTPPVTTYTYITKPRPPVQTPASRTPFRDPGGSLVAPLPLIPPAVGPGQ